MNAESPLQRFVSKLDRRSRLSEADRSVLLSLPVVVRRYGVGDLIIPNDGAPTHSFGVVREGFASCFKVVRGAHRQVVSFALPGDTIDLASILLRRTTVHAECHRASELLWVSHQDVLGLCRERPAIAESFWLETIVEAAIAREWAANIGQRPARMRLAHLFLELRERLAMVGLANEVSFGLPVSQKVMASALGLSLVHYNKSFRALRDGNLVMADNRAIAFPDLERAIKETGFDPAYLHFGR